MRGALGKRAVLRAGYAIVVGVLVLSAVEAYRIQTTASRRHLEIYRHYVDQDQLLSTLRLNIWLAGNYIRDFFIAATPERADLLRSQIATLRQENETVLGRLQRASEEHEVISKLRQSLDEFWNVAAPVPTMLHATREQQYDFVQREIVPRRGELYAALRALTAADQQRLENIEGEFANSRREASSRLLLMLVAGVLLSMLVARLSLRHAENLEQQAEKHYAAVEQTKGELQQLSARLLEIEEEGKRKLSRELHDEIGQTLALLQIEISRAQTLPGSQSDALRDSLARAHEMTERTVQTIRNMALLLRPALLDDLGLVPALQFLLEDFMRRSRIATEFVEDGVADHFPDAVKTCVYRVLQEALHNCEKHSGATRVRVAIRQFPELLLLEVEDDGRGFNLNPHGMPLVSSGLGLLGIRERAANSGGTLTIDSSTGHGTRIALRVPLAVMPPAVPAPREVTV
jgi:signal transduction histidine kinase